MAFVQTVSEEQKETKYQCCQNGNIIPDADHQRDREQGKYAYFDHIISLRRICLPLYDMGFGLANKK
jgi:hypothetical protein